MSYKENTSFIFFLTLDENLPKTFYVFDSVLKSLGYMLVPVKIDQLQTLVASTDQTQVMVLASTSDAKELKLFNEKVRGLLKFVLKSKRITFMHLSSFSKLNDCKIYVQNKNYFFIKYPLDARHLSEKITRYHGLKAAQALAWPGGKRAGVGAIT